MAAAFWGGPAHCDCRICCVRRGGRRDHPPPYGHMMARPRAGPAGRRAFAAGRRGGGVGERASLAPLADVPAPPAVAIMATQCPLQHLRPRFGCVPVSFLSASSGRLPVRAVPILVPRFLSSPSSRTFRGALPHPRACVGRSVSSSAIIRR